MQMNASAPPPLISHRPCPAAMTFMTAPAM
jgi:hypothetical protein